MKQPYTIVAAKSHKSELGILRRILNHNNRFHKFPKIKIRSRVLHRFLFLIWIPEKRVTDKEKNNQTKRKKKRKLEMKHLKSPIFETYQNVEVTD